MYPTSGPVTCTYGASAWGTCTLGGDGNWTQNRTVSLTSSTYCSGGSVPNSSQTCTPPPTGLVASCPAPGTSATVSWTPVPSANGYYVRIDKSPDSFTCTDGDSCLFQSGSTFTFDSVPGATYKWWVHSSTDGGTTYSDATFGTNFICNNIDVNLNSQSSSVPQNTSTLISWSSTGADSCTVTKNGSSFVYNSPDIDCAWGGGSWNGTSCVFGSSVDQTACTNMGGSYVVGARHCGAPAADGSGSPCWTNTTCTVPGANVPKNPNTSGSKSSGNLAIPTTFVANCTKSNISSTKSIYVAIGNKYNDYRISTTTDQMSWNSDYDPCTLSIDGGQPISVDKKSSTTTTPGSTYVLTCANADPYTLTVPAGQKVTADCVPSQSQFDGNYYVNKSTLWTANLNISGAKNLTTSWSGDNISTTGYLSGNTYSKIYTTVGEKTINATIKGQRSDGSTFTPASCSANVLISPIPETQIEL